MITIKQNDKVLISCDSVETVKYFLKKKIEDQHKRIVNFASVENLKSYDNFNLKRVLIQKVKMCDKLEALNNLLDDISNSADRSGLPIKDCNFHSGFYQIIT